MRPPVRTLLAALLPAFVAGASAAQDIATRPYVFTQGHDGATQRVDSGRPLQVQLPSNSGGTDGPRVIWTFLPDESRGIRLVDSRKVPSAGRIAGFDEVTVFDFVHVSGPSIEIRIAGMLGDPGVRDGSYVLNLIAK